MPQGGLQGKFQAHQKNANIISGTLLLQTFRDRKNSNLYDNKLITMFYFIYTYARSHNP